jgi:signal transduction histidine kinase/CheY-like chemotaxis protein/HPt (histidine-containing phosphotransfer) domain-containing protein
VARQTSNSTGSSVVLTDPELADVRRSAHEALARQSVAGIFATWVLAAVVFTTNAVARHHLVAIVAAALWISSVCVARLAIARSFDRVYPTRAATWLRWFAAGLVVSSATWGIGGAALIVEGGFDRDSWLVLLTQAGISAGAVASLSGSLRLFRAHIACTLLPTFAAGVLFMPGGVRLIAGFALVVAAFAAFLWIQAGYTHASTMQSLVGTKLLQRHTIELDAARLESIEANRAKSEFLANMSHEIRTPMAAVIGYADLLLDPQLGPSERVNHVQVIRRNGEHLMSLVNDILDLSKIEAGKMTVENIATSPLQIIVEVASLMRVRAVEKRLLFEMACIGTIPDTIQSDPTRLKQVVMNLVGNAIKFTEKGGVRLAVQCDQADPANPRLVVEVVDSGVGMSPEQMGRVFESFAQADASTTRRFGGSGLGLVISKRLADLLGGTIDVESALGRGSVFRLSVPTGPLAGVTMVSDFTEATTADRPSPSPVRHVPNLGSSSRVLLAEDGVDNQVLVSAFLIKAGATVKVVTDGEQAVREAMAAAEAGTPYDVVLMDMQMPVMDGYSATSKLRLMGYAGAIVALTAHAMVGDRERCQNAGCDEYLTKPVDRAQLTSTVARFTDATANGACVLLSTYRADEDMREIVRQFVRDLPERSSAILRAYQSSDLAALKRLAHQLAGAAGGYGFPRITEAAREVEQAVDDGDEASLPHGAETLAALCRRARAA